MSRLSSLGRISEPSGLGPTICRWSGTTRTFEGTALTAFGTVRVNDGSGASEGARQLIFDGGGNPLPGDLFTVPSSVLGGVLTRHKIWRNKDNKIDFFPGLSCCC